MAEYTLTNTAAVVDASIQKVANATTTPLDDNPNMVTSGGVKAYVDTQVSAINTITTANVVQSVKTDTQTIQGATSLVWVDITDLEVNITPSFSNSKLLIRADVCFSSSYSNTLFKILVDGSEVGVGNNQIPCSFSGGTYVGQAGMSYIYSGNLTAGQATNIKIQGAKSGNRDIYVNSLGSISQVMVTEIYKV